VIIVLLPAMKWSLILKKISDLEFYIKYQRRKIMNNFEQCIQVINGQYIPPPYSYLFAIIIIMIITEWLLVLALAIQKEII